MASTDAQTAVLSEGITPIPISEGDYAGHPNPHAWMSPAAGVKYVENFVKTNKIPAVFCDSTVGDKMKPIVQATGTEFGGTLYVDSLTGPDGDVPTYLDLLRYDAELITKGLSK